MIINHNFEKIYKALTYLTYMIIGTIVWLLLIISAPLLKSSGSTYLIHISEFIYFIFEPVCHQIPERSILLNSEPMAVCSRCFSVYLGGFLFIQYVGFKKKIVQLNLNWVFLLCIPAVMDFLLEKFSIYTDNPIVRILTGLLLGVCISYLILYSISDSKNIYLRRWKHNNGKSEIN